LQAGKPAADDGDDEFASLWNDIGMGDEDEAATADDQETLGVATTTCPYLPGRSENQADMSMIAAGFKAASDDYDQYTLVGECWAKCWARFCCF
jgi:hypothetical protein